MTPEAYLCPPEILTSPGPRYADASRRFQGIPGIELSPNGRLWATWYGGGNGEDRHNYVMLNRSDDGGQRWSDLRLVIDPDGEGPVRAYDPCLWHDPTGRLWLFWAQGYEGHTDERAGVWAITTHHSDSENPAWSGPERICDGIMMNKPIVLSSGEWLLPASRWGEEKSAGVCCSTDQGGSWGMRGAAPIPDPEDRNCDEHMLVELRDGRLWMLVRTGYGIGESFSTDRGRTWNPVEPSDIEHPTSRFFIRRLRSGNLLLVKHGPMDERTGRSHLRAFVSEDEGENWAGGLLLDEREGISYPDGVQAPDGTIHIIYDYDRQGAKEILLAKFGEADAGAGEEVSGKVERRRVVNRAAGKSE